MSGWPDGEAVETLRRRGDGTSSGYATEEDEQMQVEFRVTLKAGRWSVLRGSTAPLYFADQKAALTAAKEMARAIAARGERGVVRLQREGAPDETFVFEPDAIPRRSAVTFNPEADFARRVVRSSSDHRSLLGREP